MAAKNTFVNLVLCLGIVTLVCGGILAGVYVLTEEPIEAAARAKKQAAIAAVLPSFETLEEVAQADGNPSYIVAYDASGDVAGYVVNASAVGFGGPIRMMVGFRPDGSFYNVSVLEHSETPGLGAKCTEDEFAGQFKGFDPAVGKLSVRKDGGDVDAITASTITSRAFCAALKSASDVIGPLVRKAALAADTLSFCADSLSFGADSLLLGADSVSGASEIILNGGQGNE